MKRVYLCSPLRGDVTANLVRVREVARQVALAGDCPIVPHELVHVLDDGDQQEREIALRCGLALLEVCDEVLAVCEVTAGMSREISAASELGIPVRFQSKETEK